MRGRLLNDGRAFRIVKAFRCAGELREHLARLGWSSDLGETATHFVYGSARPPG